MFGDVGGVPAVFQSGHEGGFGGGGSWVFALVIIFFALVFFRGGLGREGHDGGAPAAAAFTEINGRFNSIEAQIAHTNELAELRATHVDVLNNRTDTLLGFKDAQLQLAECCCATQKGIESLKYEGAKNTCDIITANTANTQRVIDKMTQSEIAALRDRIAEKDLALSQCAQNAYLVNQLKPPCPVPAYITCNPAWPSPQPFAPFADGRGFGGCGNGCFA
jgi:hypothetical protein